MGTFYHGDCLFVLRHDIAPASVDLIYLDPPFFTGKVQKGTWLPEAMEVSYEDSKKFWAEKAEVMREKAPEWLRHIALKQPDFASYLYYMMERLRACQHVLKPKGSIYLHCDWRASHYLKMVMDEVFGYDKFLDEIAWCYEDIGGKATGYWKRKHDAILFYRLAEDGYFKQQYKPLSESTVKRYKKYFDENEQITYQHLLDTNPGVFRGLKGTPNDLNQVWLDAKKGQPLTDWWTGISAIRRGFDESTGYPTQKPERLLEIIIDASSKPGNLVLDPFCGCGTATIVASKLDRQWIGIDIDASPREKGKLPTAFQVIQNRGHTLFEQAQYVTRDISEIKEMDGNAFESWVNEFYKATKPHPDKGVDGIRPDGIPIQAKTYLIKYPVLSEFVTNAKLHPIVPKPIKEIIAVSQTGFDDGARKRRFEIETADNIKVHLETPETMLRLDD